MALFFSSQEPFLQSKAQLIVLPVSTDGNLLHPVLARCKSLYQDNYQVYQQKAMAGELELGMAFLTRVPRQVAGLGVVRQGADYVANLVVQKFPTHQPSVRMLTTSLKSLKPQVYELMRYQGIRRVACLASPLLTPSPIVSATDDIIGHSMSADDVMQVWRTVFDDVPKLTIELYFAKNTALSDEMHS